MAELLFAHCRKCKYELTGLARVGRCPECGQRYNLNTGWGTLENADPTVENQIKLRKFKTFVFCWITGVSLLLSLAFLIVGWHYLGELGLIVTFIFFLATLARLIENQELKAREQQTLEQDEELLSGPRSKQKQRPSEAPRKKN